jgi:acyl carrier protein
MTVNPETRLSRQQAEDLVQQTWREVLGLQVPNPDQSFFDAGGNSLLAIRLLASLRERLDVSMELLDLFRYPTIHSFLDAFYPQQSNPAGPGAQQAARAHRSWQGIAAMRQQRRHING